MGWRCGKSVAMISQSLCRDTALNMFRMSSDTSALVGLLFCCCGCVIYL